MPRRYSGSAEVRFLRIDYGEVIKFLKEYARRLVETKGVRLVVLFGSFAKGDYTATSDADLLIVSDKTAERPIDRIPEFMEPGAPVAIEPRVLKTDELRRLVQEGSRFVKEVFSTGVLLAGDEKLFADIREKLGLGTT